MPWFTLILGHLWGDYMFQNNWMALNKSKMSLLGWSSCLIHCTIYSLAVCLFMNTWELKWFVTVFLSHIILDKFGIVDKYMKLIKGRSLSEFLKNPDNQEYSPMVALQAGFGTFVYVMVDNTMHITMMYYAWRFLYQ